jgi:hypothetical protein
LPVPQPNYVANPKNEAHHNTTRNQLAYRQAQQTIKEYIYV